MGAKKKEEQMEKYLENYRKEYIGKRLAGFSKEKADRTRDFIKRKEVARNAISEELAKIQADKTLSTRERIKKKRKAIEDKMEELENQPAEPSRKPKGTEKKRKRPMPTLRINPGRRRLPEESIDYSNRQDKFRNDYDKLRQEATDAISEDIAKIRANAE